MTFDQLEPSANAPWTSTIVGRSDGLMGGLADWPLSLLAKPVTIKAAMRILVVRVMTRS